MAQYETIRFGSPQELALAVAEKWLQELRMRGAKAPPYSVALAGGRIAGSLFTTVAQLTKSQHAGLDSVHFFWGDERCVPPIDPESNFRLAQDHLLTPLGVPELRIHRIRGEEPPESAATQAEKDLCGFAPAGTHGQPVFDLIFLGMGEDGHVASLFPGEPLKVVESKRVYRPVVGPKPPPRRITLGYPAIAAARQVWLLISGPGKERVFRESLSETRTTPLARVLHSRSYTAIFTDLLI